MCFGIMAFPRRSGTVVYSSVDLARLDVPPLSRAELDVPEKAALVVSAGALVGHKDHETLIKALPEVKRRIPHLHVLIAGEGKLRGSLETLIEELGLKGIVRLLGHRTDVPRLIRAADLYVSSQLVRRLGYLGTGGAGV